MSDRHRLRRKTENMKALLVRAALTTICAAALVIPSFAQISSGNAPQARNPLSRLQKTLNLSDAQVSQLQGLLRSQRGKVQPLFADVKAKRQALQSALQGTDTAAIGSALLALRSSEAALKNAHTANHNALVAVLTPAQAQILTDYETIAKNGGAGLIGGGNRFGGHRAGQWRRGA
jgi:hypothetical protein